MNDRNIADRPGHATVAAYAEYESSPKWLSDFSVNNGKCIALKIYDKLFDEPNLTEASRALFMCKATGMADGVGATGLATATYDGWNKRLRLFVSTRASTVRSACND